MGNLYASLSHTEYSVHFGQFFFFNQTQVCLSLDSVTSKVMPVVDGQLLGGRRSTRGYIFVYFKRWIITIPKQSECNINSYNKDTVAFCKCQCPDLIKQLILLGFGISICKREEDEFRPGNISLVLGYDSIRQKRFQLALRFGTCLYDSYSWHRATVTTYQTKVLSACTQIWHLYVWPLMHNSNHMHHDHSNKPQALQ